MNPIDTITQKVVLIDTVNLISKQEAIDLYKKLLEQETSNHNTFLLVVVGTIVLFITATWWWNKTGAEKFIIDSVKKELKDKEIAFQNRVQEAIKESIQKQLEPIHKRFSNAEMDIYRTMAIGSRRDKSYAFSASYWSTAIEKAIELDHAPLIRNFVELMLETLKENPGNKYSNLNRIKKIVDKIPEILFKEKTEIKEILEKGVEYHKA